MSRTRIWGIFFVFFIVPVLSVFALVNTKDYQKAAQLVQEEKYDEAIEVLKKSLDENPDQATAYNLLGLIYLKQNESVASAIGSFEQAIRLDPAYADAYFNLASTFAGAGNRPKLAAQYFRKTLEVDPSYQKAYFGLGWFTLTSLEDPEKALEYFQKAVEYFPNFGEAQYGVGLCYVQMNKAPMALQAVSQLRKAGREDLASFLESVIRGGKVSEIIPQETIREVKRGEPLPSNVPNPGEKSSVPPGESLIPSTDSGNFTLIDI